MTWAHFVDFLTVLFWSCAILLFLGCVHDARADRRQRTKAVGRPGAPAPYVPAPAPGAGERIPSPRHTAAPTSRSHDTRGA
jgi:hypothetical protein